MPDPAPMPASFRCPECGAFTPGVIHLWDALLVEAECGHSWFLPTFIAKPKPRIFNDPDPFNP